MVNTHWGGVEENNHFGTHEFMALCEMLGAEPYISGNVGSGTVREMSEWVEYLTRDGDSPMARLRAANGHEEPWRVRFWGLGNEAWGCGGNMTAEHYAHQARRYGTYCRDYGDNKLYKIAAGANAADYAWTAVAVDGGAAPVRRCVADRRQTAGAPAGPLVRHRERRGRITPSGRCDKALAFPAMTFTTPPAPVDVESAFREFAGQARPTVRLHPRAGEPGPHDSSLGGPLLWPSGERWPVCPSADHQDIGEPVPPVVAVLQLFARDVPELPFPDGADLLQVLWCPGLHEDGYWPLPMVRWRDSASVSGPLTPAPEVDAGAAEVEDGYLPAPCVLSPERVSAYADGWELDDDLRDRVTAWSQPLGWDYFYHLGAAPGTAVGGWPDWIQDPQYPACEACGTTMTYLLTIASEEADGESWRRWVPVEELPVDRRREQQPPREAFAHTRDAGLMLADVGSMYLFVCETCPDRPVSDLSQCS
jgi:hypothetical protein